MKDALGTPTHNGSLLRVTSFTDKTPFSTTEGWLELFLTPNEKYNFSRWRERINDRSITHRATKSFFDKVADFVPENIAPNVVTAVGLACLGQTWYITNLYGEEWPIPCTWLAVFNIMLFFVTNSIDQRHADRVRQRTPLGDLFKYCCDSCTTVFLAILTVYLFGGTSAQTQWYAVQASQLLLFTKHLSAFHRNDGLRYNVLTGPGEVLLGIMIMLSIRGTLGLDWFIVVYEKSFHRMVNVLDTKGIEVPEAGLERISDPVELGAECIMMIYYAMYVTAVIKSLMLRQEHGWSRFGVSASLLMRCLPAVCFHFGLPSYSITMMDVICDGLFMSVLTSDITLAKMAGREIHPWVVLMGMAAVANHLTILVFVIMYYMAIFTDLCHFLNMPLMTISRNVYCDGVYDLCHIGHKTLFKNALTYGNRLFVGVVGDKDAGAYKRPPIMTHDERCAEVAACKAVTKVIPNAPCFGLTKEFLDEHQIHVVAFGEEYLERWPNPDDDKYYSYPRKIGIAKPLPRTKGLSTSDLIKRIQSSQPADDKKTP